MQKKERDRNGKNENNTNERLQMQSMPVGVDSKEEERDTSLLPEMPLRHLE
jgi:hypothetical protein